jgi:hypothetical protein
MTWFVTADIPFIPGDSLSLIHFKEIRMVRMEINRSKHFTFSTPQKGKKKAGINPKIGCNEIHVVGTFFKTILLEVGSSLV